MSFKSFFSDAWENATATVKEGVSEIAEESVETINQIQNTYKKITVKSVAEEEMVMENMEGVAISSIKKIDEGIVYAKEVSENVASATSEKIKETFIAAKQIAGNTKKFIMTSCPYAAKAIDYVKHTRINIGGDFEITVGAQAKIEGKLGGAKLGLKANADSIKLFGAEGKLGTSYAEGFKKDGEISWVGKDKKIEVSQGLSGEAGAFALGGEHSAEYKKGLKVKDTVTAEIGPVEVERENEEGKVTDSSSVDLIGFDVAFFLGIKGSISISVEHENEI